MNHRFIIASSAIAAIGLSAMFDAAVKAALLLCVAWLLIRLLARGSAALRHSVWLGALAAVLILPILSLKLPRWQVLPEWLAWSEIPAAMTLRENAEGSETSRPPRHHVEEHASPMPLEPTPTGTPRAELAEPVPAVPRAPARLDAASLLFAWAALSLCFAVLPLRSVLRLRRLARSVPTRKEGRLFNFMQSVGKELRLRSVVRLHVFSGSAMPMAWGFRHGHLLLPEEAETWSDARLRSVLLHELGHLRRRDPLALMTGHAALAWYWFNPLVWIALRKLREEQERACDDLVLRHGVRASDYAGDLLDFSGRLAPVTRCAAAHCMARRQGLESRIAGILASDRNHGAPRRSHLLAVLAALALVAAPLAMIAAQPGQHQERGQILDRNGIVLATSADGARSYPFGALASHVIGFVNPREAASPAGSAGSELLFEEPLAKGGDVRLALDAALQSQVQHILAASGIGRGAVVVLDCNDGGILACASFPDFAPQRFADGIAPEDFKRLNADARLMPLKNRALAANAPGSTLKLLTTLAACGHGGAPGDHTCEGWVMHGNMRVSCWIHNRGNRAPEAKHGTLGFHDAIKHSCNPYFTQLANELGADRMARTAALFGLDGKPGSGLAGESAATLFPGEDAGKDPSPHTIAMTSIGQGHALTSPLHLAAMFASVGNGGKVWVPRVARDGPVLRTNLLDQGFRAEDLDGLHRALIDCVATGTAAAVRSGEVAIAGMTGTAQAIHGGKLGHNAWFVGYAPAERPRFAIAVMIEGGSSGGLVAGPIARRILETAANPPAPARHDPVEGHDSRVDAVR